MAPDGKRMRQRHDGAGGLGPGGGSVWPTLAPSLGRGSESLAERDPEGTHEDAEEVTRRRHCAQRLPCGTSAASAHSDAARHLSLSTPTQSRARTIADATPERIQGLLDPSDVGMSRDA